jgi:hypothetical protein
MKLHANAALSLNGRRRMVIAVVEIRSPVAPPLADEPLRTAALDRLAADDPSVDVLKLTEQDS